MCPYSSEAEHFLGKEEVGGSIPLMGSIALSLFKFLKSKTEEVQNGKS